MKEELNKAINNEEFNIAEDLIKQYEIQADYDIEVKNIKAVLEFYKGNVEEAKEILLYIFNKFEFNFDMNINLGIIYIACNEYRDAIKYFIRSMIIDTSKVEIVMPYVETILNNGFSSEEFSKIKFEVMQLFSTYQKVFPKSIDGNNYVGKMVTINDNEYGVGIYDYYLAERTGIFKEFNDELYTMYKLEMFNSSKTKRVEVQAINSDIVIPIMSLNDNSVIHATVNGIMYELNKGLAQRFCYYTFNKNDQIIIESNDDFIIGKVIERKGEKSKPKLVLNVFVDGLSQKFLDEKGFKNAMPNSYNFFKEGTICTNNYVSGDWTYVSLASFFTGMYSTDHKFYHPDFSSYSLYNKKLFSEVFQENGYFTSKIDGDWRSTPTMGYAKGIDRYVYQPCVMGMHTDEVINETIEHLDAFKEKNNFMWICLPDLHDIADEYENRLSVQVNNPIETRVFHKTNETSVRKTYDEKKIFKYGTQLRRIDRYLGMLFNYIKENYKEDEYIISVVADHGQGYFIKDEFLDDGRIKTAMMFRGKGIPKGECTELTQGMDLFPVMLNAAQIKDVDLKDGNVPKYFGGESEREYVYSESIFCNDPYRATINDKVHKFFFETKENCQVDSRFKIDGYTIKLINKSTNKDETSIYEEKVEKYLKVIFNHIKEYIII
ncbi:sulfatase [Clostridium botulinum]|nr:sulfatase [Clostridium botulinum]